MRRILIALVSAVAVFGVSAAVTLAASPNFHYATPSIDSSTGALTVDFKLSGLGNTITSAPITLSADASATYQCFNNGGKHPKAGNKETLGGPITSTEPYPVRNGQVTTPPLATAGPLSQGSFTCPSGQSLYLQEVSYSNIMLSTTVGGGASITATPSTVGPLALHLLIP